MKSKKVLLSAALIAIPFIVVGCKKDEVVKPAIETSIVNPTNAQTQEVSATIAPVPETQAPTQAPAPETQAPTKAPAKTETAWSLLSKEPLNPKQSGYPELDNLVNSVIAKCVTDGMNGYQKAWACYEYILNNIKYSRGFADHTGAYSSSDPATTPIEVLWATDLLNSGQGACYNYSSTYVYLMRALGFDAHLVSGDTPKYGGGTTPHCWLYVNLGGKKYTFDPDLDQNYYNRELSQGVKDPLKDRWFCRLLDDVANNYKNSKEHTN